MKDHLRAVPDASLAELRRLLLTGEHSVMDCGRRAAVGGSTAYKIFHELQAEFAGRGEVLPVKKRGGAKKDNLRMVASLPGGRRGFDRYRELLRCTTPAAARVQVFAEHSKRQQDELAGKRLEEARRREEARRPKPFEEVLRLVEQGQATLSVVRPMLRVEPVFSGAGSSLA